MSPHPHVLIFDSGVGGLSVAREVLAAYPQCRLTYASDNSVFPYGNKTSEWLIARVQTVIGRLIEAVNPDVIVIACNTASTVTLPYLRSQFSTPFVGVVPAIKPAAGISRTKVIGVLATPATVSRAYTKQLIADYAADCSVLLYGSSELVFQAEKKLMGQPVDHEAISDELHGLLGQPHAGKLDTIVLACTHFPLLRKEMEVAALPRKFQWIDSGEAIARRVGYWLAQTSASDTPYHGAHGVVFTAPSSGWPALQDTLSTFMKNGPAPGLTILEI
jgi:glutamate racemase